MTEASELPVTGETTAGALLRAAREKQGVHIAVLAAAIKISPRKLDALEGDRYSELPDATFTRALAQTVCRALKIDSQPVMALLPSALPSTLDAVGEGLNTPFRDKLPSSDLSAVLPRAPLVWAALALLGAAAIVYYWPAGTSGSAKTSTTIQAPPVAPPTGALPAGEPARPETITSPGLARPADAASAAAVPAGVAASAPDPDLSARPLNLPPTVMPSSTGATVVVSEPVWLEVIDGSGQVVFQRTIQPGETLNFDQTPPLKVKIGNATAAKLTFRGEPVDLATFTRGSVARVVLK